MTPVRVHEADFARRMHRGGAATGDFPARAEQPLRRFVKNKSIFG